MDTMPWNFVILGSIPEAILLIYLGLLLLGKKPKLPRVLVAGALQGVASYFVRKYTGFGVHMLLQLGTFFLLVYVILKESLKASFLASLLGFIINILVETPYVIFTLKITGWSFGEIMSRSWLRIIYFMPKLAIITIILFLCKRYGFTLEEEIADLRRIGS